MAVRFSLLTQQGFAPTPLDRHVANTDLAEAPRALQWTTLGVLMLIALLYSSIYCVGALGRDAQKFTTVASVINHLNQTVFLLGNHVFFTTRPI